MRPLFISIEGLDGSGGTTQVGRLAAAMRDRQIEVLTTFEPSQGPVGQFIRKVLGNKDPASRLGDSVLPMLFAADRRDHLDREVLPALLNGQTVITDRYYHSSLAYQSLAVGLPAVAELNAAFRAPDITVLLDLEPEICLERIAARGAPLERFEALDKLRQIRDGYEAAVVHCRAKGEHIIRIDAAGTTDAVHARVLEVVLAMRDEGSGC